MAVDSPNPMTIDIFMLDGSMTSFRYTKDQTVFKNQSYMKYYLNSRGYNWKYYNYYWRKPQKKYVGRIYRY